MRDRVVQTALRHVLEPIFETGICRAQLRLSARTGLQGRAAAGGDLLEQGYVYVVDADLKSYFDTIPHAPLLERVQSRVTDRRVLALVECSCTSPSWKS